MLDILRIEDLRVSVSGQEIVKGLNFNIKSGEIHALMGPNGSGKSTLAQALAGSPSYVVTQGEVRLKRKAKEDFINLLELSPDERARAGLFLAFQYPLAVPGVTLGELLREAYNVHHPEAKLTPARFRKSIASKLELLHIDESFLERYVNDGFSGGEKKKAEILQLLALGPRLAILDETDSGLDVDALRIVAQGINSFICKSGSNSSLAHAGPRPDSRRGARYSLGGRSEPQGKKGVLLITHYQRILDYIEPNRVHIMMAGQIIKSGGKELAEELEQSGYDGLS